MHDSPSPPPSAEARFAAAEALHATGQLAAAEAAYRALLDELPGNASVLHNLALVAQARGDLDQALLLCGRAIDADRQRPVLHNSLGTILQQAGRIKEAGAAYRHALGLWPQYAEAQFNLGVLAQRQGRSDDALAAYQAAVQLQPTHIAALTRVAALLIVRQQYADALPWLDQALEIEPDFFDALYYRGWALGALGRTDEALACLEHARRLRPDSVEVAQATANALRDAGRNDAALDAYWKLLELRPDRTQTHEELNKLAWTAGRDDLFLRSFAYARERRGEDVELLALEAGFMLRRREPEAAEALLRRARASAPGRGDVAGLLARALAAQGRFEDSYPLFLQAIGAEPNVGLHRIELGFTLLRDRQPGQARAVFEAGLARTPNDQLLLAALYLADRQLGDARAAGLHDIARYVRVYDLGGAGGADAFNRALAGELDALHMTRVAPLEQTLRGGTQTTGALFAAGTPKIGELRERIEGAVADYVRHLEDAGHPAVQPKSERFRFSGSWSCRLATGGFHDNHVHPQGWISSAYYVRLPAVEGPDPRAGWLKFGESNLMLGEADTPLSFVKPQVGRLVLFPSFFWHGTVPFAGSGDRLTVAFDVVPDAAPAGAG